MYTVLIIDDEDDILESVRDIFEFSGQKVYTASSGAEGLKMLTKVKPDIILCDISMPDMDGYQVRRRLGENKNTMQIPFIFLTAKADIVSMRRGMSLGADDYIIKPVHPRDLIDIVNARLSRIAGFKSAEQKGLKSERLGLDDSIPVKEKKEITLIKVRNISVIKISGDYACIHTAENRNHSIKKSIKNWIEILPEKKFIRVHRNFIVNIDYVEKIETFFNDTLIARIKYYSQPIQFSKRYSREIKKLFKN